MDPEAQPADQAGSQLPGWSGTHSVSPYRCLSLGPTALDGWSHSWTLAFWLGDILNLESPTWTLEM